ncbi:hypothetical protein BGX28_006829 [Mortierella sp. GBA30]|nr:hypothetical protein BGX28_006829 [Mortierella sp. GBA30]
MARFNSKLTLILGLCAAMALAKTANQAAVDDRPQVICSNGNCYPRVFRPTADFQEVLEGQEIPGGLHVQMDFETHKKYAKLMDPEDVQEKDATNSILVVDTDQPGTFQHSIGSDNSLVSMPPALDMQADGEIDFAQLEETSRMNLQTAFDSIPELKHLSDQDEQSVLQTKETKAPNDQRGDFQIFTEQLDLVKTSNNKAVVADALEELTELAGDMEFGLTLSTGEPLKALVTRLHDSEYSQIRSKSAMVIGAAVQNHIKAQQAALRAKLHKVLLKRLETESDEQVLRRLISAYGSLVRGINGSSGILQDDDISRLAEVYNKSTDALFRRKCIYIMSDFADPDFQPDESEDRKEAGSDKEDIKMVEAVNVGPWCESLQQENQTRKEEHGDWEIIERAVGLLHASYPETCILTDSKVKDEL